MSESMLHASELACLSAGNLESLAKELRNVCEMLAALKSNASLFAAAAGPFNAGSGCGGGVDRRVDLGGP